MIIETKYDVDQVVEIIDIEIEGTITEIKYDGRLCYLVEYWRDLEIKTVWQYEFQLQPRKKKNCVDSDQAST